MVASSSLTFADIVVAVEDGVLDEHLDRMWDVLRDRSKKLRDRKGLVALQTLSAGDRVRLTNIKPKRIKGALGTVSRIGSKHVYVTLDDQAFQPRGVDLHRFSRELGVPPSCVEAI